MKMELKDFYGHLARVALQNGRVTESRFWLRHRLDVVRVSDDFIGEGVVVDKTGQMISTYRSEDYER